MAEEGVTSFTWDDDFEDGEFGSDGEFYYKEKRSKKRSFSKNHQIYGIWYDSEEDGDGNGNNRRPGTSSSSSGLGRNRNKKQKTSSRDGPVSFVSKGSMFQEEHKESQQKKTPSVSFVQKSAPKVTFAPETKTTAFKSTAEEAIDDLEEDDDKNGNDGPGEIENQDDQRQQEDLAEDDDDDEEEEDNRKPKRFRRRNFAFQSQKQKEKAKEDEAKEQEDHRPKTHKEQRQEQEFSDHYGMGFKLLQKIGNYRLGQGLGAGNQGRIKPVEVTKRANAQAGLSFGDRSVGANAKRSKSLLDIDPGSNKEEPKSVLSSESQSNSQNFSNNWKKSGSKKGQSKFKKHYKTAEEIAKEAAPNNSLEIIDMRGPQAIYLQSGEDLKTQTTKTSQFESIKLRLKAAVNTRKFKIQNIEKQISHDKQSIESYRVEQVQMSDHVKDTGLQLSKHKNITQILTSLKQRLNEDTNNTPSSSSSSEVLQLENLLQVFLLLNKKFTAEFKVLKIDLLAVQIAKRRLIDEFSGWKVLEQPGRCLAEIGTLATLLNGAFEHTFKDASYEDHLSGRVRRQRYTPEDMMVHVLRETWVPPVRSFLNSQWRPKESVGEVVDFFQLWEQVLPKKMIREIYDEIILRRLRKEVQHWDPRKDTVMVHTWLHPWLPHLGGDSMSDLWQSIKFKLGSCLQEWHPSDSSALILLSPWKGVFDEHTWESLMIRSILPKLLFSIRSMELNPKQQNIEPFRWLMTWSELLPIKHVISVLENEFFPRWLEILQIWLKRNPNYDEIVQWYVGWKGEFPAPLLKEDKIKEALALGLKLMNQALSK